MIAHAGQQSTSRHESGSAPRGAILARNGGTSTLMAMHEPRYGIMLKEQKVQHAEPQHPCKLVALGSTATTLLTTPPRAHGKQQLAFKPASKAAVSPYFLFYDSEAAASGTHSDRIRLAARSSQNSPCSKLPPWVQGGPSAVGVNDNGPSHRRKQAQNRVHTQTRAAPFKRYTRNRRGARACQLL